MTQDFSIFIVDDSEPQRIVLESVFGEGFATETFESADACLARLSEKRPDLFLLDVEMPGMNGYELCKHLKEDAATSQIPVMFVSAYNDIESRLRGYDSGGEDFIGKPLDGAEVRQKVAVVRRIKREQAELAARLADSDMLSSLIMSNLDEYAVVIKFLRQLNSCETYREIAEALIALNKAFGLEGPVQLRLDGSDMTLSEAGENRPLEVGIMQHLRSHDRIFEFQKRLAINFDHAAVLINNMPTHDPDFCGRIRDHVAIAVESADARIAAMLTAEAHDRTRNDISAVIQEVVGAVTEFRRKYDRARYHGALLGSEMADDLSSAFATLALTTDREEGILDIVRNKTRMLMDLYDFGDATHAALQSVTDRLTRALGEEPAA